MNNTRIVELVIEDDNQELAIDAISLVSAPAIEQDFVFFGKQKNNLTFAKVDEEKRMLISPALIPDKQIFRYDPNTDSDYYVYFSKATVRKASELYLKHNNHHKATYEHQDRVSGVLTVESWIIEDTKMDKSNLYGFSLPKGTWMVMLSISNDDLWSKIKSGELKGLSIEGYFTNKFEQMQKKEPTTEEVRTALKELLSVQKVELAMNEDIKKSVDEITFNSQGVNDILKILRKDIPILRKLIDNGKSRSSENMKLVAKTEQLVSKFVKAAKELGLPSSLIEVPSKSFEKAKKQSEDLKKEMQSISDI